MANLSEMVAKAKAAYDAMSPEEKAHHDYEQRRSFVRGMCPSDRNLQEWSKEVDRLLPPMLSPYTKDWVIGKLKQIANTGQSIEPDHWKFRCMAREVAQEVLDKLQH